MLAVLDLLEVMARQPGDLSSEKVRAVRAAGVPLEAIRDAAYVCALFSTISRIADALGWDVPADFSSSRTSLVKFGYRLPPGL